MQPKDGANGIKLPGRLSLHLSPFSLPLSLAELSPAHGRAAPAPGPAERRPAAPWGGRGGSRAAALGDSAFPAVLFLNRTDRLYYDDDDYGAARERPFPLSVPLPAARSPLCACGPGRQAAGLPSVPAPFRGGGRGRRAAAHRCPPHPRPRRHGGWGAGATRAAAPGPGGGRAPPGSPSARAAAAGRRAPGGAPAAPIGFIN